MKKIYFTLSLFCAVCISVSAQEISFQSHMVDDNFAGPAGIFVSDLNSKEVVTDYDGNTYTTVVIGIRTWLRENLKSLHYSDGTEISEVWAYNDEEANVATYGRLYTWNAAMNNSTIEGAQGVCPDGWHVPTDGEWTELGTYLGGDDIAGGKLKEAGNNHWFSPNTGATNESGFTALPAGEYDDTHYQFLNEYAVIWSSTETNATKCKYRYLSYEDAGLHTYNYYKNFRYSVRCLKNNTVGIQGHKFEEKKIKVIPNPAIKTISIQFSAQIKTDINIEFYDITGKVLITEIISPIDNIIDVSELPKGIYLITANNNGERFTGKFVKN